MSNGTKNGCDGIVGSVVLQRKKYEMCCNVLCIRVRKRPKESRRSKNDEIE